jgi:hypothetical protein
MSRKKQSSISALEAATRQKASSPASKLLVSGTMREGESWQDFKNRLKAQLFDKDGKLKESLK